MTILGTTLTATWPTALTASQQTSLQATVAAAITDGTVAYTWHADTLDTSTMLPIVDTDDVEATCPVCQAEFKLGAMPV